MKEIKYSFKQWCIDNYREDLLNEWDYDLNTSLPSEISYKSNKKYWFKCSRRIHESQLHDIQYFASGRVKELKCKKCESFAQFITDSFSEEYLIKIWNKENIIDPWKIAKKSNKKAIFNCEHNESHVYEKSIYHYSNGSRCPFCVNAKILKENSLGVLFPEVFEVWSDKNKKSPYEYAPNSGEKVWWKCKNGVHEDYQRRIADSNNKEFKCPKCSHINAGFNRIVDLTNKQFGELFVLGYNEEKSIKQGRTYWNCLCRCNNVISVSGDRLTLGNTRTCGDRSKHYAGGNSWSWQGGITPERLAARTNLRYKHWRNEVYKKDWYTCQCCGKFKNINKQAHHIIGFANNEDLRYEIENGITLCEECHYTTIQGSFHNIYGTINNTLEQLEEFINNKRKNLGIELKFSIEEYRQGINILKPIKEIKTS